MRLCVIKNIVFFGLFYSFAIEHSTFSWWPRATSGSIPVGMALRASICVATMFDFGPQPHQNNSYAMVYAMPEGSVNVLLDGESSIWCGRARALLSANANTRSNGHCVWPKGNWAPIVRGTICELGSDKKVGWLWHCGGNLMFGSPRAPIVRPTNTQHSILHTVTLGQAGKLQNVRQAAHGHIVDCI